MAWFILKIVISAVLISFVSWLSGKTTALAGFLTALPMTTLLALAFSQIEWKDQAQSVAYAKSIFFALPLTLLFFVPFLFAQKWNLNFWHCYFTGIIFLVGGYGIHHLMIRL